MEVEDIMIFEIIVPDQVLVLEVELCIEQYGQICDPIKIKLIH